MEQLEFEEYLTSIEERESITLTRMDRVTDAGIVFDWPEHLDWMLGPTHIRVQGSVGKIAPASGLRL